MRMGTVLICVCAERGLEDSAIILIATWQREGPAMTQQFNMSHGHPDGDLLTSILAYEWFLANRRDYKQIYTDWRTSWTREWNACAKVGLMHHVLVAIHESVMVLQQMFNEHKHAFPEAPKRHFGSPGYSTLLLHSVWTAFFDRCLIIVNHWEDQFCRDVYQDRFAPRMPRNSESCSENASSL